MKHIDERGRVCWFVEVRWRQVASPQGGQPLSKTTQITEIMLG